MGTGPCQLEQHLAGKDVPCPTCRYNLRDLTTDTCLECGRVLTILDLNKTSRMSILSYYLKSLLLSLGIAALCFLATAFSALIAQPFVWFKAYHLGPPNTFVAQRDLTKLDQSILATLNEIYGVFRILTDTVFVLTAVFAFGSVIFYFVPKPIRRLIRDAAIVVTTVCFVGFVWMLTIGLT